MTHVIERAQGQRLRRLNVFAALLHAMQATVMVILTNDIRLPVTAGFGTGPPGQPTRPVGWLMETSNPVRPATTWAPFVFGCVAGIFPWVGIAIYLVGAGSDVPGFVYGIFVSLFVMFNSFAIVQFLQYLSLIHI